MKAIAILFLLGHILGDFYFQTDRLAESKQSRQPALLQHCFLYAIAMVLVSIPFFSWKLFWAALLLGVLHCFVDECKFLFEKHHKTGKKLFLADQAIHLCCIVIVAGVLTGKTIFLQPMAWFQSFEAVFGIPIFSVIAWLTLLLVNYKPAGITVFRLIGDMKPEDKEEPEKNAGRWIGLLERLLMMIFLVLDQFAAIGLVLTAKSIARYDRISKDQQFAEYYLLGTLLSTLIAVASTLLIL